MHFFITSGPHKIDLSISFSEISLTASYVHFILMILEMLLRSDTKKRKEATFEKGTNLKEEVVNNGLKSSL